MSDAEHNDLPENNDAPGSPGLPGTSSSSETPSPETPSPSGTSGPLDLPGSQVHREPMPSVRSEEKSSGEGEASGGSTSGEALTGEEHPEEEPSEEKDSGKESRGGRPLREPVPDADPVGTWILAEEIPTNIGQPHWALRQRNFFAERRSLLKDSLRAGGSGGEVPSGEDPSGDFPGREVPGEEAPSGDASSEDASMSIRISRLQEMLLGEAWAASCYRTQSAYLRAAAAGRDRRASVIAKSGAVLFWTLCHLGEEVGLEEWARLGSLLRPLLGMGEASLEKAGSGEGGPEGASPEESGLEGAGTESAGMEETRAALTLIRRHLLARRLSSGLQASGGPAPGEVLPPAPEEIRKAAREAGRTRPEKGRPEEERPGEAISGEISSEETRLSVCISMRIGEERKKLIRENALQSSYNGMSRYVRHVALGWDRAPSVLAECATIARWVERHLGRPVGQGQWDRLEEMMMEEFGVFLLGSGGQKDVDHVLREGTCHLLGAPLETIIEETGISP